MRPAPTDAVPRPALALVTAALLPGALSPGCSHSACSDTDVATLVATMHLDDFTRASGEDGRLDDGECRAICASWFPALASINTCVASDPVEQGEGDTAGGDTGSVVAVSCTGHYYCW